MRGEPTKFFVLFVFKPLQSVSFTQCVRLFGAPECAVEISAIHPAIHTEVSQFIGNLTKLLNDPLV